MKKVLFLLGFYISLNFSTYAQIAKKNSFWIQSDYFNELVYKKNITNSKKYFNPIKLFLYSNNKLYFQALNSRISEAIYDSLDNETYVIRNVQKNVNLKYFSKEELQDYRFHIKKSKDRLLLIKIDPKLNPDTVNYILISEMSDIEPVHAIDGYLLLKGNFNMIEHNSNKKNSNITFSLNGEVSGGNFIKYKVINSSILIEGKYGRNPNFLIEFQDKKGKNYKKALIYLNKNELELYDCLKNGTGHYELLENSRISLIGSVK